MGARGGAGGRCRGGADRLSRVSRTDAAGRRHASGARDRPGCAVGPLASVPAHTGRGRVSCPMPTTFRYIVALALYLVPGGVTGQGTAVALPVARRRVPRERLRVSPEFAEPPDSLTERIRLEQELVQGVRQRAHETPRLWRVPFVRPRASGVTSGFGVARVFNKVLRSRHWGVDFAGRIGAPVRAANRGVVALVADLYYSGTTVLVDHGAGLVTGYFHLSRVLVVPGDTVDVGQPIGRVGSSGRVTKAHLHWSGAYGGITVDPLDLIRPNGPARLAPGSPP